MKRYNFYTAMSQAVGLYGIELEPEDFETLGLIAWNKIGNKDFRWYRYEAIPEEDYKGDFFIDLPCNVDEIEAVTAGYEDVQKTHPVSRNVGTEGAIEDYIEAGKRNTGLNYASGEYVKYHRIGNTIYLSDKFSKIYILYKGYIVDENGLPYLTERELDAVAAYCAYATDYKEARKTRDRTTFEMAQLSEAKWKTLCTQARIPDYINQNKMDEILDVASSWDRKRFGRSFKPVR